MTQQTHTKTSNRAATSTSRSATLRSIVSCSLGIGFWLASQTAFAQEAPPCGISQDRLAQVRALQTGAVARGHAPGMVVLIQCDGRPVLESTEGLADVAGERPMTKSDLFRIFSMTKPLTTVAAMMLAEQGRIRLDDPLSKHLPEFSKSRVYVSGEPPEAIETIPAKRDLTVRDLMRHTAGIPYMGAGPTAVNRMYALRGIDHGAGPAAEPKDGSKPLVNAAELSKRIAAEPLLAQPGELFIYGNATDVLGALVEAVEGRPLHAVFAERIFKPLAMNDTFFEVPKTKLDRLTAAYAARSSNNEDAILKPMPTAQLGQGFVMKVEDPHSSLFAAHRNIDFGGSGLVSTASDYQRFLGMMLGKGVINGVRLLKAESVAEMTRNQLEVQALKATSLVKHDLGFGLGFGLFSASGRAGGAVPANAYFWGGAASTYFWVDPARRITGVVMTQVFGGDVMPYYLEMLDALYREPAQPVTAVSGVTATAVAH
jgi:CubicO group peptidase (beta-lactamase class C family)